jgi:hypothetical protein
MVYLRKYDLGTAMRDDYYFYTYTIHFESGHYYHGRRSCKCRPEEDTEYFGKPGKAIMHHWKDSTKYFKVIESEYLSREELDYAEYELIGDKHFTDPMCLNNKNMITKGGSYIARWEHLEDTSPVRLPKMLHRQYQELTDTLETLSERTNPIRLLREVNSILSLLSELPDEIDAIEVLSGIGESISREQS